MSEVASAVHSLKRNTTPGTDGVTYSMLWNLPDTYLEFLLTRIKEPWDTEILPSAWQEVLVILIPKPEKPPDQITTLRPISVTSCAGKLMEKRVHKRLGWHLDNHNVLRYTMIGVRKHVCTLGAMLRYTRMCTSTRAPRNSGQ